MENNYIIRDYCIIRDQQVVRGGNLIFESKEGMPGPLFAEIYRHFEVNYPKFHKMDNLCKLGFLLAELLIRTNNIGHRYPPYGAGIVLFNASSSLDTDRNHQRSIQDRSAYFPSPSVFVYTLANIVIGEICIRHKFFGESTFFIEEEFDAVRLYAYVKQLLDDDVVKYCLTGWIELNDNHYDGVLYLVEKTTPDTDGIAIFDPGNLTEIYLQRT